MEGQFFLMGVAGLSVSLAGFSSLLTLFRANGSWDPVALWRARTIVRASLDAASAALKAWPEGYSVVPFYVISAVTFALMFLNLVLASLGLLLLLLMWELGLPAGIFVSVVEEFRPGERLEQPTGDDGKSPADR